MDIKESFNALRLVLLAPAVTPPEGLENAIDEINLALSAEAVNTPTARNILARRMLRLLRLVPCSCHATYSACIEGILFRISWCRRNMVALFRARIGGESQEELAWEKFGDSDGDSAGDSDGDSDSAGDGDSVLAILGRVPGVGSIIDRCFEEAIDRGFATGHDRVAKTFRAVLVDAETITGMLAHIRVDDLRILVSIMEMLLPPPQYGGSRAPLHALLEDVDWTNGFNNPDEEMFRECCEWARRTGSGDRRTGSGDRRTGNNHLGNFGEGRAVTSVG